MRKINQKIIDTIAESLASGPAGSLELKKRVDRRLNRNLPLDTFYRYKEISKGLGIIDSKPQAKKVRGGYQTVHSLTERAKKYIALGFSLVDITKYQYHKDNHEIVSVGDWTNNDELYQLFLIMSSIDTIESVHVEKMLVTDENEMLERVRVLVPAMSIKDLVVARKEVGIDGSVATYYKPVSCMQIVKEEYPAMMITKKRERKKRSSGKITGTNLKATQQHEENKHGIGASVTAVKCKITFYNIRILGASASDIVHYNKDNTRRGQKFTGMITQPFSLNKAQRALSVLQREQLIVPIGKLKGKTRYTICNTQVRRFIGNCLVIQDQIINLLNRLWQYRVRKINSRDRMWLEMIYGHRKADRIISNSLSFLDDDLPKLIDEKLSKEQEVLSLNNRPDLTSSSSYNGNDGRSAAVKAEIEKSRKQVEHDSEIHERYIRKQIEELREIYEETFSEYCFPIERIMQLVVLPSKKLKNTIGIR
jgi:hypothetical protein